MPNVIETVLSGSGDFVAAVAPALRGRAGAEPRMAGDARQAFALCAQSGGLLVFQYRGPEWLPVVQDLRSLCGDAIAVVAAVAPERLPELSQLQRAGADEVVPWDGSAQAVQWAVERALVARRARLANPARGYQAPADAAPPLIQRRTPAPGTLVAPQPATPLSEPPAQPPAAAPAAVASSPAAAPWPSGVPDGPDAEWLLLAAVTGAASAPGPQRQIADGVASGISDLERAVLRGASVPVDVALLRGASVLRLRVALALGSVPGPGAAYDPAAVQALVGELDAMLGRLKAAGEGAAREVLPGLEAVRTALVKEAIDLTEAVQRLVPAAAPAAGPAPRPAAQPAARVLSMGKVERAPRRLPVGMLFALGVVAAAAGAFHLHRHLTRPAPPSFQYRGAPADTIAAGSAPGKPTVVVKQGGAFDALEIEKLKQQEELRGRSVQQLAPGTLLIVPEKPAAAPAPAPQPSAPPGGTP